MELNCYLEATVRAANTPQTAAWDSEFARILTAKPDWLGCAPAGLSYVFQSSVSVAGPVDPGMISNRLAEASGLGGASVFDAEGTDRSAFWEGLQQGDTLRFDWPAGDWYVIGCGPPYSPQSYLPLWILAFQPPEFGSGLQPDGPVTVTKLGG